MAPPRLYVITDRRATGGRSLVEVVAAAVAGAAPGEVAVQLREKDLPARDLVALARALLPITRAAGARLLINDRLDVALAAGADGVHLGRASLSVAEARALAPGLEIAASTHDEAEVRAATGADWVVYGPVFETPSKRGVLEPRGVAALARACGVGVPVLALGGIDDGNARECLRAGAAGLAFIRAVIAAEDPRAAVARFRACFVIRSPGLAT